MSTPAWMLQAACRGMDPALFFPPRGGNEQCREALAVCDRCPVRAECLDYALSEPSLVGIWGGASDRARRRMPKTTTARCRVCGRHFRARGAAAYCSEECRRAGRQQILHDSYLRRSSA